MQTYLGNRVQRRHYDGKIDIIATGLNGGGDPEYFDDFFVLPVTRAELENAIAQKKIPTNPEILWLFWRQMMHSPLALTDEEWHQFWKDSTAINEPFGDVVTFVSSDILIYEIFGIVVSR